MIELQPLEEKDFDRLIEWVESPEFLMQWAGPAFTYPLDKSQLGQHLESAQGENSDKVVYKAVDTDTDEVVGHIEWSHIDRQNQNARLSRVLIAPDARGGGSGTEMVKEMVRLGFEEFEFHRIELHVFEFNKGAIACYEKAGFQKEGLIREARKFGNEFWSAYRMSILESDWLEEAESL
ncbi:MAG TPA: GNAT family protein [Bacillales bacterium]